MSCKVGARLRLLSFLFFVVISGCSSQGVQSVTGAPVTDVFETFKRGEARLNCEGVCSGAWGFSRAEAKNLYDRELWSDLVNTVSAIGFKSDQTYYYLGRAAEGLEYYSAARQYYNLAMVSFKCDGVIDNCDGLTLPRDALAGLKRLPGLERPIVEGPKPSLHRELPIEPVTIESSASNQVDVYPVSSEQWGIVVDFSGKKTNDWLSLKSAELADKATQAVSGGKVNQGRDLSLQSSVLTAYYLELQRDKTSEGLDRLRSSHADHVRALSSVGLSGSVFEKSLSNLKGVFSSKKISFYEVRSGKDLSVRKASSREVAALDLAIRQSLFDPDSAKFSQHVLVGGTSACVVFNAKNRMGGYSGPSAHYLEKIQGSWYVIYKLGPLDRCVDVVGKVKSN